MKNWSTAGLAATFLMTTGALVLGIVALVRGGEDGGADIAALQLRADVAEAALASLEQRLLDAEMDADVARAEVAELRAEVALAEHDHEGIGETANAVAALQTEMEGHNHEREDDETASAVAALRAASEAYERDTTEAIEQLALYVGLAIGAQAADITAGQYTAMLAAWAEIACEEIAPGVRYLGSAGEALCDIR